MANTYLEKQAKRVRAIRREHPNMKYIAAVKLAAKQLKSGSSAAPKKRKAAKKRPAVRKTVTAKRAPRKAVRSAAPRPAGLSVVSTMAALKRGLLEKLGSYEAKKFDAKKVTDKRKIAKQIAEVKKQIRKLS